MSDLEKESQQLLKKLDTREGLIELCLGTSADDEYNPAQPNDFEKMLLKRKNMKKDIEVRIKKEKMLKE